MVALAVFMGSIFLSMSIMSYFIKDFVSPERQKPIERVWRLVTYTALTATFLILVAYLLDLYVFKGLFKEGTKYHQPTKYYEEHETP